MVADENSTREEIIPVMIPAKVSTTLTPNDMLERYVVLLIVSITASFMM